MFWKLAAKPLRVFGETAGKIQWGFPYDEGEKVRVVNHEPVV